MKVDLFDFELPPERIAQAPADPRDSARLLHVADQLTDRSVRDLPELFDPGDLFVVNNTRVLPTRLVGKRGNGTIEATLHKQVATDRWWAFCRPAKRLGAGDVIQFDGLTATVVERDGGNVLLSFDLSGDALILALKATGAMPLPPYIKRDKQQDAATKAVDGERYQTTFARVDGAVAAPTAGLHFTPELVEAIKAQGARFTEVTLHVGAGTFLPVTADETDGHQMHSEWWELSPEAEASIASAKRVVAVGTTSLRTLEASGGQAGSGDTDIFITPGYEFRVVDRLLTNFHLPRSTLFMLVSAFSGLDRMQAAYAHAIANDYRFFSYGDACLLERSAPKSG